MTTLSQFKGNHNGSKTTLRKTERRSHRRHDLEMQTISVQRWAGQKAPALVIGQLVDMSSGGMRIRTAQPNLRPEQQVRVRVELPAYAGISPFIDTTGSELRGKPDWTGWMAVIRVQPNGKGSYDVAGRLLDMEDLDRGMLGLYLSTQPTVGM